jgi:hypothetical protein
MNKKFMNIRKCPKSFMALSVGKCFGSVSGSGSGWIRIQFGPGYGIRIRIQNPDQDVQK